MRLHLLACIWAILLAAHTAPLGAQSVDRRSLELLLQKVSPSPDKALVVAFRRYGRVTFGFQAIRLNERQRAEFETGSYVVWEVEPGTHSIAIGSGGIIGWRWGPAVPIQVSPRDVAFFADAEEARTVAELDAEDALQLLAKYRLASVIRGVEALLPLQQAAPVTAEEGSSTTVPDAEVFTLVALNPDHLVLLVKVVNGKQLVPIRVNTDGTVFNAGNLSESVIVIATAGADGLPRPIAAPVDGRLTPAKVSGDGVILVPQPQPNSGAVFPALLGPDGRLVPLSLSITEPLSFVELDASGTLQVLAK